MSNFNTGLFGGPGTLANGSTTATQIVYAAFRLIQVLVAPGQGNSGSEIGDGLDTLNALIDSWNTEMGTIPAIVRTLWPLIAGQQAYAIGPGAVDFDAERPGKIEAASTIITSGGDAIEKSLYVLDFEQWKEIGLKSTASSVARSLYYDRALTTGNLYVFPVPSDSTAQLGLYTRTTLAQIPDATTPFALAPGYKRGLTYGLAMDLGPRWPKAVVTQLVADTARESKASIQALNCRSPRIASDTDLGTRGGTFDYHSGMDSSWL